MYRSDGFNVDAVDVKLGKEGKFCCFGVSLNSSCGGSSLSGPLVNTPIPFACIFVSTTGRVREETFVCVVSESVRFIRPGVDVACFLPSIPPISAPGPAVESGAEGDIEGELALEVLGVLVVLVGLYSNNGPSPVLPTPAPFHPVGSSIGG